MALRNTSDVAIDIADISAQPVSQNGRFSSQYGLVVEKLP